MTLTKCIYLGWDIDLQKHTCLLGHQWPCETDGTVCGDYEGEVKIHE